MTRFKLRAMFAVIGLIVGATIWASVGISQENKSQPVPAAGLPGGVAPATEPATFDPGPRLPNAPAAPATVPPQADEPTFDPNPPKNPDANTPNATPLVPGETATERLDRLRANPVGQPATGTTGFGVSGLPPSQQPIVGEMPALRVIAAETLNASSLKEIVETLIPTARGLVAVDTQTNSLVVRVPDATFDEIKKLAMNLRSEVKRPVPKANEALRGGGMRSGGITGFESGSTTGPGGFRERRGGGGDAFVQPKVTTQMSSGDLKREYEHAEKAARDLAVIMKANPKGNSHQQVFRALVAKAFSIRQSLLRAELADMQRRVDAIQESINLRAQVGQQIIDRRVNELLDPNLQWEPASIPAIGPGGFMNSSELQRPQQAGMPGGMGPGSGGAEGSTSNGKANFTYEPVPDVPSKTGISSGFGGSKAADPAVGSLSLDSGVRDIREVTLHIRSDPKLVDRDIPAIVMQQNPKQTLLVAACSGLDAFLLEIDRRPVISIKVNGSDSPVELVAVDHNLGIAIFSVPTSVAKRLTPWPKDEIADVRIGDVITCQGTSYRLKSSDQIFVRRMQKIEVAVNGALVFDGRIDGNLGSVLLKNGKLAGMLLDSVESAAGESKSYALPAQTLFDRFDQLLEKSESPKGTPLSAEKVSESHGKGSSGSSDLANLSDSKAPDEGVRYRSMVMLHLESKRRGAERLAPAIVVDSNATHAVLVSASWSIEMFLVGADLTPVGSVSIYGSKQPVNFVAVNHELGVAIFTVQMNDSKRLVPWSVDDIADVQVGDLLGETDKAGLHQRRVKAVNQVLIHDVPGLGEVNVEGAFVIEGQMLGNPGTILSQGGKFAGMFLNNAGSNSQKLETYVLPAKAVLGRYRQLLATGEIPMWLFRLARNEGANYPEPLPSGLSDAPDFTGKPVPVGPFTKAEGLNSTGVATSADDAKPAVTGPVLTLHMSAPWRGAERDAPAIVIDANDARSILLSSSWSAQPFPAGVEGAPDEGAPVRSITLVGSNLPVRRVDKDDQLGIAIYSVRTKLPIWPVDQLSSDIRVGDVVEEVSSAGHFGSTKPFTRHRVESVGNTLLTGTSILIDTKIEGTFALDGRMSGNPGSILLKDGKLAGMFLDNSRAADSSESKSHGLPTKTLLERARLLMKRSQRPVLK